MKPKYTLDYIEMEVMQLTSVHGRTVTLYPAAHTGGSDSSKHTPTLPEMPTCPSASAIFMAGMSRFT